MGAIFLVVFALLVGYGKGYGKRDPRTHDEFAYLLTADTFASGRLTNPTHPMWRHFETLHVFHQPTYQAKYPPAQGSFLALGQALTGEPIVGVWLSFALAIGALAWMLAYDGRWPMATLIAATAAVHPEMFRAWGNTFWGGAVAMLGGALLWGGLLRLHRRLWWPYSVAMGIGLLILSQSRQLEGSVAGFIAGAVLVVWSFGRWRSDWTSVLRQVWLPLALFVVGITAFTLFYNAVLSAGNPWKLAYLNWNPRSSGVELVRLYTGVPERGNWFELRRVASFFVTPWMAVLLLALVTRSPRKSTFLALLAFGALLTLSVTVSKTLPHYLAPVAPLLWLLFLAGWDALWSRRAIWWKLIAVAAVTIQLLVGAWYWWDRVTTGDPRLGWHHQRADIVRQLESTPGMDLVMVSYAPDHDFHQEWVYNAADIDGSSVVWARFIDPESDRQLREYFSDRRVWKLEADVKPPVLRPLNPED